MLRRLFFAVALAAMLGGGTAACVASKEDTELNPQPLPPLMPDDDRDTAGAGSGGSQDAGTEPDAGAEADTDAATDAGDAEGGVSSTDGGDT